MRFADACFAAVVSLMVKVMADWFDKQLAGKTSGGG